MKRIEDLFKNKKILILGYGKEGKSTHKYIVDNFIECNIFISDQKDITGDLYDENVTVVDPEDFLKDLDKYDIIMQSPGVSMKDINIVNIKEKLYSQTEIFFEVFKDQIIGVTGTKGKSTTTSLIAKMFRDLGKKVEILGNIGVPFFSMIDNIDPDTIIVAELSCHQLQFLRVSPHIGIILNIYPEHLDHYNSFEEYRDTKTNLIKNQSRNDYAIVNIDNENIKEYVNRTSFNQHIFQLTAEKDYLFHMKQSQIYYNNEVIFDESDERNIPGEHNLFNIMVLFAVANIYGITNNDVKNTIASFKPLEHRMEFVRTVQGVKYYNDSISTIPETCIAALDTYKEIDTIIVGGMNRGISYDKLIEKINSIPTLKVICMYDVGKLIFDQINNEKYYVENLNDAVKKAQQISNSMVMMSPAAPSYGFFKNFEDRGNQFKEAVKKL